MSNSKEYNRKYYLKNKEKIIERNKENYKNDRENRIEMAKKYQKENADKKREYNKIYYKEYSKEYSIKNARRISYHQNRYIYDLKNGNKYKHYRTLKSMINDINRKYYFDRIYYKNYIFIKNNNELVDTQYNKRIILDEKGKFKEHNIE